MRPPTTAPRIPDEVEARYAEWGRDVAWQIVDEVVTYRLTAPDGRRRFLKLATPDVYPTLLGETERVLWAARHLPVPHVIEHGSDGVSDWLVTEAMDGVDATDSSVQGDVEELVRTLARGLRRFHGAPVADCPFDFRLDSALRHARRRLEGGRIDEEGDFHPEYAHLSAAEAIATLETNRPADEDLVVCHGDYCLPNVLLTDGEVTGFLDLGELGVADRWSDVAVGAWSVAWNLGPGHEDLFYEAYGIEPDRERIRFYRLLYDVVS